MNNEDMSELFNKFSSMINEGNIPDDMKNILSSISSNSSSNFTGTDSNNSGNTTSDNVNSTSSDNNNVNGSNNSDNTTNASSIDFDTILKMKNIMDKINKNSNDPRANLLLSLKPYLKESRKEKVDQYIKLFGMSRVLEAFDGFRRW